MSVSQPFQSFLNSRQNTPQTHPLAYKFGGPPDHLWKSTFVTDPQPLVSPSKTGNTQRSPIPQKPDITSESSTRKSEKIWEVMGQPNWKPISCGTHCHPSNQSIQHVRSAPDPKEMAFVGRGTWLVLHTLAARFPLAPLPVDQTRVQTFLNLLSSLYPEPAGRDLWAVMLAQMPPRTQSRGRLMEWMVDAHNFFNQRLEKPIYETVINPTAVEYPSEEELGRAAWKFLHAAASCYLEAPSSVLQKNAYDFFTLFCDLYPCATCKAKLPVVVRQNPPRTTSKSQLCAWVCELHNAINGIVGKPVYDCVGCDYSHFLLPSDAREPEGVLSNEDIIAQVGDGGHKPFQQHIYSGNPPTAYSMGRDGPPPPREPGYFHAQMSQKVQPRSQGFVRPEDLPIGPGFDNNVTSTSAIHNQPGPASVIPISAYRQSGPQHGYQHDSLSAHFENPPPHTYHSAEGASHFAMPPYVGQPQPR